MSMFDPAVVSIERLWTEVDRLLVNEGAYLNNMEALVHHFVDESQRQAIEQEQQRIGRDLHDGVCQTLSGLNLLLRGISERKRQGEEVSSEQLTLLAEFTNQAVTDTRPIVRGLVPPDLDAHGLELGLRGMLDNLAALHRMEHHCEISLSGTTCLACRVDSTLIHPYRNYTMKSARSVAKAKTACCPPANQDVDIRPIEGPLADDELAMLAKALGHPARVQILRLLVRKEACMCGDIVDELPLAQSTVSQHLKVLKTAGLIRGEIDGPRICYCIEARTLRRFKALIGGL